MRGQDDKDAELATNRPLEEIAKADMSTLRSYFKALVANVRWNVQEAPVVFCL